MFTYMVTKRLPTDKRREQIAEAALSILSDRGARAVTVAEIARAVGVTGGAVFRHFKDKQELFDAAVSRFESYLTDLPSASLPPLARLEQFFLERVEAVQARPEILGLAFNDRLQEVVGAEASMRVAARLNESAAFIRGCIEQAQHMGDVDADVRADVVLWMVTGAMRGAARTKMDPKQAWAQVRRALFQQAKKEGDSP